MTASPRPPSFALTRALTRALTLVAPPAAVAALGGAWTGAAYVRANRYVELGRDHLAMSYVASEVLRSTALALAGALPILILAVVVVRKRWNLAAFAVIAFAAQAAWLVPVLEASESWRVLRVRYGLVWPNLPWRVDAMIARGAPSLGGLALALVVFAALTLGAAWLVARRTGERGVAWPGPVWRRFGVACAAVVVLACSAAWAWPRLVDPPRTTGTGTPVVFLTWDSTRADHLSAYGYERDTTPRVAELGRDGLVFERAYSNHNWTRPSYMSMLTSKPAWELDLMRMRASSVLLAEVLRDAGYATRAFVQNPHLNFTFGMDQGFDRYMQFDQDASPAEIAGRVAGAIDDLKDRPFFLFVHMQQPHWPYLVRGPFLDPAIDPDDPPVDERLLHDLLAEHMVERWDADAPDAAARLQFMLDVYDGDILETDAGLGAIVDHLKAVGLYEETLIVFNSDHGDEFFDHESFGHAHLNLHQEVVRVPMVVKAPARLGVAPGRPTALVQNMDVYPTVLDALGLPRPEGLRGDSLFALATEPDPERLIYSTIASTIAVRSRDYLFVRDFRDEGEPRFFHVAGDPRELTPVDVDEAAPLFASMRAMAEWWGTECWPDAPRSTPGGEEDLPPDVERRLRDLGYLGD